jgi:hypothetical protein
MAQFAFGWCVLVNRVIRRPGCGITIVTGSAIIDDAGVIEGCRAEVIRVMADAAILIGVHVAVVFTRGEITIMAGPAVILDTQVIKGCGYKTGGLVAIDAIPVSRHMEVGFTGGGIAIMTRGTVTLDALVIKRGTGKRRGVMAQFAFVCVCVLANIVNWVIRRPGRRSTIVAGDTVIHDAGMIEHRRCKGAGNVADIAILVGRYVIRLRILAGCIGTIVAGITAGGQHSGGVVVDFRVGKVTRVVADTTITGGVLMNWRIRRLSCV